MGNYWFIEFVRVSDKLRTKKWDLSLSEIAEEFDKEQRFLGYAYVNDKLVNHNGWWFAEDENGAIVSRINIGYNDAPLEGDGLMTLFDASGNRLQPEQVEIQALREQVKRLQEDNREMHYALAAIACDPFDSKTWFDYCKPRGLEPYILTPEQKERGWSTWQLSYKAIAQYALNWINSRRQAA